MTGRTVGSASASVAELALPLRSDDDLDPLLDRIADARVVCVGEASHGTHEFYDWRARVTRRLIEEKGFSFVGVEGDWPDCHAVSCSVTGAPSAPDDPLDAVPAAGARAIGQPRGRVMSTRPGRGAGA